jgi:hypothetical protein
MCKGSLLVRITFSFSSLLLSVFLCPFIFTRRSLFTSKWPWSCSNIYIHAEGEIVQAVFSFFSISFRVTVQSYMYACARSMNGYNITYKHTYIYIIKRKEAKLRPEQKKKLALISFSLSLLFFCSISRIMTTIFHCLFSNFAF